MKYIEYISSAFGTPGLIALLVCLLGAPLAYYFTVKANRRKIAHEAFKEFEKTFTLALHHLNDTRQTSYVIVHDEFPNHEKAMLAFEHILDGERKSRFKIKWAEYKIKCKKIEQYGYSICLGEEGGPPTMGILEHIKDRRQGNLIEIEPDKVHKRKLCRLINELFEIAKH